MSLYTEVAEKIATPSGGKIWNVVYIFKINKITEYMLIMKLYDITN